MSSDARGTPNRRSRPSEVAASTDPAPPPPAVSREAHWIVELSCTHPRGVTPLSLTEVKATVPSNAAVQIMLWVKVTDTQAEACRRDLQGVGQSKTSGFAIWGVGFGVRREARWWGFGGLWSGIWGVGRRAWSLVL